MFKSNNNITETSTVTLSPNENGGNVSNVSGNMKKDRNGIHMVMFYISIFGKRIRYIIPSTTIIKVIAISLLSIIVVLFVLWLEMSYDISKPLIRDGFNLTTHQTVQIDHKSLETSILTVDDINRIVNHWNASNPKNTIDIVDSSPNTIKVERVSSYTMHGHEHTTLTNTEIVIFEGVIDCKGDFQQRTKETMIWTLYHEIGHLVGLGHTKDLNHLMYGSKNPSPTEPFNDLGFNIPNITRFEHTTEREAEISKILNDLESNITEERRKELTNERNCIQVIPK